MAIQKLVFPTRQHARAEPSSSRRPPLATVLFVEASSGGVVGGSLTGLVHQMYGMGPQWRSALVLCEPKAVETDLRARGVAIHHIHRWRVPKEHALRRYDAYHAVRRMGSIRSGLHFGRLVLRTAMEELPAALALVRIIRAERAAVVHLGNGLRANFDGVLASWLTRTPCVVHVKGFEKYENRERWSAPRVDALVCMTEAVKQHCVRSGLRSAVMPVIYDAVDVADFRPRRLRDAMRSELELAPETCAVGIVAGIQEWKGQAVVIEAVARARAAAPGMICLIVGGVHRAGNSYARQLQERVAALGLGEQVRFVGFRSDVPDVMHALDVVVHASIRPEPFGRVILEGMLLGRPVVAAAAGGVPEFVDHGRTGFLVPPGDSQALADALVMLAGDPELRRRVGTAAQADALQRFSLARHVEDMTALYDSLIKGR